MEQLWESLLRLFVTLGQASFLSQAFAYRSVHNLLFSLDSKYPRFGSCAIAFSQKFGHALLLKYGTLCTWHFSQRVCLF